MTGLLIVHLVATAYMTGLIWFVQAVHYPLMAQVGEAGYADYQRRHMRLTSFVVIPAMLAELIAAGWIAARMPSHLASVGVALLVVIWACTFIVLVPCHKKLSVGFDADTHRALVGANRLRTLCWTARCVIAAWMLLPP